jgi:hypothetical protein
MNIHSNCDFNIRLNSRLLTNRSPGLVFMLWTDVKILNIVLKLQLNAITESEIMPRNKFSHFDLIVRLILDH